MVKHPRDRGVLALITDAASTPDDHDMAPLVEACTLAGIEVQVVDWTDHTVDWRTYSAAVLRSPWSYTSRLSEFLSWCEHAATLTDLWNPLDILRWNLDKTYVRDLAAQGVPVPLSEFSTADEGADGVRRSIAAVRAAHPGCDLVIKPSVGAYSRGVRRFTVGDEEQAVMHGIDLLTSTKRVMVQPYLNGIEDHGEVNLIFFGGELSHAITKAPLLTRSGPAGEPTQDVRAPHEPSQAEVEVARAALEASRGRTTTVGPLLYARVDLVDDSDGQPLVHELELVEPSLSLCFAPGSAGRFAEILAQRCG